MWLLPGPDGADGPDGPVGPVEARFCRGCAPTGGPVADLACMRCGEGPLLSGALAAGDDDATAVVQEWMTSAGWRLSGPVCPDCVGELVR